MTDTKEWAAIKPDSGSDIGFVKVKFHSGSSLGEIYMLTVDPDYQRQDIGTALRKFALDWMKTTGISVVMVETRGDATYVPVGYI